MGVIVKQSIKGTIYSYLGVLLGFITSGIIMPHIMSPDKIGLLALLVAYATIFAQFASLGFNNVISRFFPYFKDDSNHHHGFLNIVFKVISIGFVSSIIVFFLLKSYLVHAGTERSPLFINYMIYIVPLIFTLLVFSVFDQYYSMQFNSVLGTFLKEFIQRIIIFLVIVLFYLKWIDFDWLVILYVFAFFVPTILIVYSLWQEKNLNLKPAHGFVSPQMKRSMTSVAMNSFLVGMSGIIIMYINSIMIERMVDLSSTGIFTICLFVGNILLVPSRPLSKIANAVIAESWKNNDTKTIYEVYYKSCINQLIIGSFIFILIWANIDNLLKFFPHAYSSGAYIIFWVAIGNLINMSTGVNVYVIYTSKYYKSLTYFAVFQILISVISNYFFIKMWGITGAGVAFAFTFLCINIMYFWYILVKFKMQPFDVKTIKAIFVVFVSYLSVYFIPTINNFIIDGILRSAIISIIFISLVFLLNLSKEISEWIRYAWKFLFNSEIRFNK